MEQALAKKGKKGGLSGNPLIDQILQDEEDEEGEKSEDEEIKEEQISPTQIL